MNHRDDVARRRHADAITHSVLRSDRMMALTAKPTLQRRLLGALLVLFVVLATTPGRTVRIWFGDAIARCRSVLLRRRP